MKNLKSLTGTDFSFLIGITIVIGMLVVGFIVK
jgi:hypothetical protein